MSLNIIKQKLLESIKRELYMGRIKKLLKKSFETNDPANIRSNVSLFYVDGVIFYVYVYFHYFNIILKSKSFILCLNYK